VEEFVVAVGGVFDGPEAVVDEGVVASAEEDEVVDVGFAEVWCPSVDVVDVAPLGFASA
jgi:hypothetical protein